MLPNGPEVVAGLFALAALGAAMAPLNPAYTEPEYRFFLADLEPRLLVVSPGAAPAARAAAEGTRVVELAPWEADAPPRLLTDIRAPSGRTQPGGEPDDTALLLHTSGTTSRPKQVPLLQRNLAAQAEAIAAPLRARRRRTSPTARCRSSTCTGWWPRRWPSSRPAARSSSRAGSARAASGPRRRGQRRHLALGRPDAAPHDPRPAGRAAGDAALHPLVQLGAHPRADARGRGPLRRADGRGLRHDRGQPPDDVEPAAAGASAGPGSVGVPAGAEVRIVDAAGADVPAGSSRARWRSAGPGLTPGYLRNDRANAEAFFDGWFRTGDEGVLEDGYLHLRGRLKEMIIRGGENISPYEIEAVLQAHPHVAEAVAFGVDDAKYGQTVAAAVVLSGDVTADELRSRRARIARRLQGARPDPHPGRDPQDADGQGAALADGRAAGGRRRVRFACSARVRSARYVGRVARPRGRRRDPDRARRAPAGDAPRTVCACRARAATSRRIRPPPTTSRPSPRRTWSSSD